MRFHEFKLVEQDQKAGFYTIGDSHAVAIATVGGRGWHNLAIGGKSSTNGPMLANISKIPEGAIVVISQGANDTANAARSTMDSGGRRKLVPPATIAANVANVVDKVKAQKPSKIFFMLFPNGPGRTSPGLAKYYGGDYQDEVRDAIKSAIDVPIIDINGLPLTDGIHATMAVYKDVANKVAAQSGGGLTLGNTATRPSAPATKDKQGQPASPTAPAPNVPTGVSNPSVRDIQQALMALGYPLPKHGADGIRGPETINAVSRFQRDNNLTVDGNTGPETIRKLNDILKSNPEMTSKITKRQMFS
jgi:lysophospholipase L1-like esterase